MALPRELVGYLDQKYALLGQQANADTARAAATTTSANAAANLDTTRAKLLPTESAAAVALQRAQALLTGNQAQTVIPESQSRIALQGSEIGVNKANIGLIGANTTARRLNNNLPSALSSVMGGSALPALGGATVPFTGYRLGAPITATPRTMTADELDRLNGLIP